MPLDERSCLAADAADRCSQFISLERDARSRDSCDLARRGNIVFAVRVGGGDPGEAAADRDDAAALLCGRGGGGPALIAVHRCGA